MLDLICANQLSEVGSATRCIILQMRHSQSRNISMKFQYSIFLIFKTLSANVVNSTYRKQQTTPPSHTCDLKPMEDSILERA